jgi:hypothetical protein
LGRYGTVTTGPVRHGVVDLDERRAAARSGAVGAGVASSVSPTRREEPTMRHARTRTIALTSAAVLLLCTALLGAQSAPASTKVAAAGTISVVSNVPDSVKQVGRTTITHATAVVTFDGTLNGPATEIYTQIEPPNGNVRQHGKGFFEGTIAGRTGALEYVFHGGATSGRIVITKGTGGLRGVHGTLDYAFDAATGVFTYEGTLRLT